MADVFDPATRSRIMAQVRAKDTLPERRLRSALHRRGFRFRLHSADMPGKPDIVLPAFRAVLFVHGCFWHQHQGCRLATVPATRRSFWVEKFRRNAERDRLAVRRLRSAGWRVRVVWACRVRKDVDGLADSLAKWLNKGRSR